MGEVGGGGGGGEEGDVGEVWGVECDASVAVTT